jgi:hypothetical protein
MYELGSEILCDKCSPPEQRFDCGSAGSAHVVTEAGVIECQCSTNEHCYCCHICKHIGTRVLDWYKDFRGYSRQIRKRVRTTGKFMEGDRCSKCKKRVIHEYHNLMMEEAFENSISLEGSDTDSTTRSGSTTVSTDDEAERKLGLPYEFSTSVSRYIEYPEIRIFNTSIRQLHKLVTRRVQKIMRREIPEMISKRREKLALELGRELNYDEVNHLWEQYIKKEM